MLFSHHLRMPNVALPCFSTHPSLYSTTRRSWADEKSGARQHLVAVELVASAVEIRTGVGPAAGHAEQIVLDQRGEALQESGIATSS